MPRVKIALPSSFPFNADIPIRVTDLNYGGHVGNDKFLSIIQEARVQFLNQSGFTELDIDGVGLVVVDAEIVYKAEVFFGDILTVAVAVDNLAKFGCDFYYKMTQKKTGREVARAKTGIVFYDFEARKMVPMPDKFRKACR